MSISAIICTMSRGRPRQFDETHALDEAMMLFWRRGYEGTSLAALTAAMGISAPSLYAAFGNKYSLFKKVLDRYLAEHARYLPNAMRETTARQVVQRLFTGAIDLAMNQNNPDGCMLVHGALATGPASKGARAALKKVRRLAQAAVQQRFESAIAEDDLPADVDAAKLAGTIMTLVWGMSVQAAGGATREELQGVADWAISHPPFASR